MKNNESTRDHATGGVMAGWLGPLLYDWGRSF